MKKLIPLMALMLILAVPVAAARSDASADPAEASSSAATTQAEPAAQDPAPAVTPEPATQAPQAPQDAAASVFPIPVPATPSAGAGLAIFSAADRTKSNIYSESAGIPPTLLFGLSAVVFACGVALAEREKLRRMRSLFSPSGAPSPAA